MTVIDPRDEQIVTIPSDLIADTCMRAYLAFDGEPVTVNRDLGNGTMIVGYAYSLGRLVTVDYEILPSTA